MLARRSLRPRGALVIKSTYAGKLALDASALVVDEIAVVGSRCGSFAPSLRKLAGGRVEVESLIQCASVCKMVSRLLRKRESGIA